MAIKLIGTYAKRLGLPGYSSHQFSVSIETELVDTGDIQGEATRIYRLLQDAVDREIQQTGFVPGHDYGEVPNVNGRPSHLPPNGSRGAERWNCSDKQKELILKLVAENHLDRDAVEDLALERFGIGVKQLNKLQASGLINELLETGAQDQPQGHFRNGNGHGKAAAHGRNGGGR